MSNRIGPKKGLSTTDVNALLERYPSRPWTSDNLSQLLHDLLASNVVGDDSDSSIEVGEYGSDLNIIYTFDQNTTFQSHRSLKRGADPRPDKVKGDHNRPAGKNKKSPADFSPVSSSGILKKTDSSTELHPLSPIISQRRDKSRSLLKLSSSSRARDSDLIDLGKISTRLIPSPKEEDLPIKIIPRVSEMVEAIKTAAKYNLPPENFKDEEEIEEKIELNRLLKWHKNADRVSNSQYKGPSIKGISTFRYVPLYPKKRTDKFEPCTCKTCKMGRLWEETKRSRAEDLAALLGEPRKIKMSREVWNCQCKGSKPGVNNKNPMVMKIRVPQCMRPDELKKLNSVPRYEIYQHITPANGQVNIKNAVVHKPRASRPIIQQEMTCLTNEMRCVLLPPPFTQKVTKFETPDWLVEYNKRYVYDFFFQQSKNIPNVSFMHFSYKKNLAVLTEEIIQGCLNRTDIFDDDTCQCTFLCTCAHKTVKKPNATLFDVVREAKKYCAADLHEGNVYEAGDYLKSGDKTYYVCSKLCNAKMKLHKQLHD